MGSLDLADQGLSAVDEAIPDEYSLSGGGLREDLELAALFMGMNPAEAAMLFKALGNAKLLGAADEASSVPNLKAGDKVFRVYGADSKASGASWTTKNPSKIKDFRNAAGLPSGGDSGVINSGRFIIEGTVQDPSKILLQRKALPLDGMKGGLPEYFFPNWMNNGAIKIDRVMGINPEF